MKTILTLMMTGCLAVALVTAQSRSAADQYQEALRLEEIKGDLKAAIAQYKKLAQGADRMIAAKALVQMAGCYEKLGQSDARPTYDRVVREFADQAQSVATARTRLAAMRTPQLSRNDISFRRVGDGSQNEHGLAVSYDGRYIAHHLHPDTLGTVAVRDLATGKVHPLAVRAPDSREQPDLAVVSRDSKAMAYAWGTGSGGYELRTIPLQVSPLAQSRRLFRTDYLGAAFPYDWSPDGTQIAVRVSGGGAVRIGLVSTVSGELRVLKTADSRVPVNVKMSFSPDGKYLAYDLTHADNSAHGDVMVMAVDGSRDTPIVAHPSYNALAGWSPDGLHLLFFSDRTGSRGLWSQATVEGRPEGAAVLIKADTGSSSRSIGVTASGALYVLSTPITTSGTRQEIWVLENFLPKSGTRGDGHVQLAWFDRTGKLIETVGAPGGYRGPELSSDGRRLAIRDQDLNSGEISIFELARGTRSRLIRDADPTQRNSMPIWSPDGSRIVFGSFRNGKYGLYMKRTDGTGTDELLIESDHSTAPMSWSRDGRFLVYTTRDPNVATLWALPLTGARTPLRVLAEPPGGSPPIWGSHAQVSPDGKWIAYQTINRMAAGGRLGRFEIHVKPFPDGPGSWQVSTAAGMFPRWRGDGKELYFMDGEVSGKLMAVDIRVTGSSIQLGIPRALFDSGYDNGAGGTVIGPFHTYAVSADGQRFLIPRPVGSFSR